MSLVLTDFRTLLKCVMGCESFARSWNWGAEVLCSCKFIHASP